MTNEKDLQLNQTMLQDFQDCPRRFELKYIESRIWPAGQADPPSKVEELTELGNRFHQLCHQYFIGIDPDTIASTIPHSDLLDIWKRFLPYGKKLSAYPHFSEQLVRMPFLNHILVAKFDYLGQLPDGSLLIVDWKTSSSKPSRSVLSSRIQTILYPFILQEAYQELFPGAKLDEQLISLQYWYPLSSDPEEIFPYNFEAREAASCRLSALISSIDDLVQSESDFPLTPDLATCKYCLFRSYCERGTQTPILEQGAEFQDEDLSTTHFEMDLINEIEF